MRYLGRDLFSFLADSDIVVHSLSTTHLNRNPIIQNERKDKWPLEWCESSRYLQGGCLRQAGNSINQSRDIRYSRTGDRRGPDQSVRRRIILKNQLDNLED